MRIVTSLLSIFLATATLGGCMARAKVRVADNAPTSTNSKVATDAPTTPVEKGQGSADSATPATEQTGAETDEPTTAPAVR